MPELIRKLQSILTPREKRTFGWLLVVFVAMAFFEVVGIASIMPFMQLVSQPDAIENSEWLQRAHELTGFDDTRSFLIFVGAIVLALLAARNVTAILAKWLQFRFAWGSAHSVSLRLLKTYVYQPYEYFLQNNSSNLGKQILSEVNLFVRFIVLPCAEIVGQAFLSLVVLSLLVAVDPKLALTVFLVLGSVYAGIYLASRRYVSRIGHTRFEADRVRFTTANELLSGIKSVKIRGCEDFFVGRFATASRHYTDVQPKYDILAQVPRHFVELLAFGGILIIVLYLLTTTSALNDVIPLLSLYALAGYRLLPALQNIYKSVSAIRFHYRAIDTIYEDLQDGTEQPSPKSSEPALHPREWTSLADLDGVERRDADRPLTLKREIRARDLSFRYKASDEWVVKHLNIVIPKGSRVAVVGPTGSGKTTFIDLLTGLLKPQHGDVLVDDVPVTKHNIRQWLSLVGYVPQEVVLYDDTLARNIAYGVPDGQIDMERVQRAAEIACIADFVAELRDGLDSRVGERGVRMSGGQRQRIGLARAIYHEPEVLVLDEATNSLDGITEEAVLNALAAEIRDVTIITIAHRLATVRDHDRIYLLDRGRVVAQGTYSELLASSTTFREMAKLTA